jgi:hypothetical protein
LTHLASAVDDGPRAAELRDLIDGLDEENKDESLVEARKGRPWRRSCMSV